LSSDNDHLNDSDDNVKEMMKIRNCLHFLSKFEKECNDIKISDKRKIYFSSASETEIMEYQKIWKY
jgi:hypothetical protein